MTRRRRGVLAVTVLLGLASCNVGDSGGDDTLVVFAAASLTDAVSEVAAAFEARRPQVSVVTSFAGSSSLREQILAGAPADVYASADPSHMEALVEAGSVVAPVLLATNRLEIAVPAGNPGDVDGLGDLGDADLLIGLCAAEVPCGDLARRVLDAAGVEPAIDTNEPDVRALLTKIEAAELDAGIVYRTDVLAAGDDVEGIVIGDVVNVVARYPIATVDGSDDPDLAQAFVSFARGDEARAILHAHGFGTP